jgi:glycine/D-amino acid oxidase-like deaminating enzyme
VNSSFETIVVGAGLGGSSCAATQSESSEVLILDAQTSAVSRAYTPASTVGPGISSPLMSRRARAVFRMESAYSALSEMTRRTGATELFSSDGVLKLSGNPEQAAEFKDAAQKWPDHGRWVGSDECRRRWPRVFAPHGLIHVLTGTAVSIPDWSRAMTNHAVSNGAAYRQGCTLLGWDESGSEIRVVYRDKNGEVQQVHASRLILALGADYLRFTELARLRLHPIKGQWARLSLPVHRTTTERLPALSGSGYLIDDGRSMVIGSTFEHGYKHLRAVDTELRKMIQKSAEMLPETAQYSILTSGSAIRVTVPGIRLPMVGPIRSGSRVWVVSGLGAKGLLMAPLIASELSDYFTNPTSIPKEFRVTYSK